MPGKHSTFLSEYSLPTLLIIESPNTKYFPPLRSPGTVSRLPTSLANRNCSSSALFFLVYLFIIFYIPWIFWGNPHLDIGIVNINRSTLYNMCRHNVYAIASIRHSTRLEQFKTSLSVTPK